MVFLQGFFTVPDKHRWKDSMDVKLHGGKVVLCFLPTEARHVSNNPEKSRKVNLGHVDVT